MQDGGEVRYPRAMSVGLRAHACLRVVSALACSMVLGCLSIGCISVGPGLPAEPFVGEGSLYQIDLGLAFAPSPAGEVFDRAFTDRRGGILVGVVVNRPPMSLADLDLAIVENLRKGMGERATILSVEDADVGGLAGRVTRVRLQEEQRVVSLINLHTATDAENIQIIIRGPTSSSHLVDRVAAKLSVGGFRFLRDVVPFGAEVPELADLPVGFEPLPVGWRAAPRGELNAEAAVELIHSEGAFLIGIVEQTDEIPFAAMLSVLQSNLSGLLVPTPTSDTKPFDEKGEEGDLSWSQTGRTQDEGSLIRYRVRLIEDRGRFLHLYCWGDAEQAKLGARCEELIDKANLRAPR